MSFARTYPGIFGGWNFGGSDVATYIRAPPGSRRRADISCWSRPATGQMGLNKISFCSQFALNDRTFLPNLQNESHCGRVLGSPMLRCMCATLTGASKIPTFTGGENTVLGSFHTKHVHRSVERGPTRSNVETEILYG
eukprot:30612-Pelagococcus_subviridis.AAC.11